MKETEKINTRELRHKLGMNQSDFWSKLGVTQSGGSRYESGRTIPRPVQALLHLIHIEQVDINKLRKDDLEVIEYLKSTNRGLLKDLKRQAKEAARSKKTT